ncbi:hypothetical protein [Marinobacter shengliensis]|uniref:hypothetical protein n=1 Tax=Marinobacter shengliensis TaxID=1389223 RepID=UPI00110926BD|nr:hypothetical protein [Marinobacter shengliensis]
MRSTNFFVLFILLMLSSTTLVAQEQDRKPVTVGDKVDMAKKINAEIMRTDLAEKMAQKLVQENEVRRQKLQARDLESQLNTSQSEIDELRSRLARYETLISNSQGKQNQSSGRRAAPSIPPLNMRVLNILRGEGITTRARVVVLGDDGASQGEFQVKIGGAIQGWRVDSINANSIEVSKGGQSFTYGKDGMM